MLHTLRPQYAKSFRCIGPDCEDTCCQGWDVIIDQDAYERFQSLGGFTPKFKEHLVVIGNATVDEYARIQLTSSCSCPFLSPERLCSIQVEHGEHYLPDICADYPRATQRIDGLRETALMLACPEAARLVLLNPDLVQPEEADAPRYRRFAHMGKHPIKPNGSPHSSYGKCGLSRFCFCGTATTLCGNAYFCWGCSASGCMRSPTPIR
ncbi:MAG TPA: flagellin lysine-N-methylase [Terriglobales bacterium]|nr:flagellin lysine-N-methylase [Terriglobales bacterium]